MICELSEKDVRLLNAAEDMLAVLERIDNHWTSNGNFTGPEDPRALALFTGNTISIWKQIRAAIEAATGAAREPRGGRPADAEAQPNSGVADKE